MGPGYPLAALILASAGPASAQGVTHTTIDPLTVADDDFARHRDPAWWRGLSVSRIVFAERGVRWRLWRIASRRDGPLWVVPHDNENAAFAAALVAVRSWGGVMIAIDSAATDSRPSARYNQEVAGGPVDPNRNFSDALPRYAGTVLADLGDPPRPIVAMHTNARGFSPHLTGCGARPPADGWGEVSIRLCNTRFSPRAARDPRWPFDDEDTLALLPHRSDAPRDGWCARSLTRADFNLTFERVTVSDGSLSNYAAQHGLAYVNFETREPGPGPVAFAGARDRLVAMIDAAMERCLTPPAPLRMTARTATDKAAR